MEKLLSLRKARSLQTLHVFRLVRVVSLRSWQAMDGIGMCVRRGVCIPCCGGAVAAGLRGSVEALTF